MWTLSGFADEIDADLERQCEVLADLDIDYIEFRSAWGVNVCDLDDAQLDRAEAVLAEYDIAMSSVGSPIGKIRVDEDFDAHLRASTGPSRSPSAFQAPYLRLFSFYPPEGDDVAEHRDEVLRRMSALADRRQAPYDVVLLHENEKGIYGDIPERCVDIVTSVGAENLKLAWDACQLRAVRSPSVHARATRPLRPHTTCTSRSRTRCWPTARSSRPARATASGRRRSTPCATTVSTASSRWSRTSRRPVTPAASPAPTCSEPRQVPSPACSTTPGIEYR